MFMSQPGYPIRNGLLIGYNFDLTFLSCSSLVKSLIKIILGALLKRCINCKKGSDKSNFCISRNTSAPFYGVFVGMTFGTTPEEGNERE